MTSKPPLLDALIVGAGFSGLALGHALDRAGFKRWSILEKGKEIGGTWRENHYPGAACDVQSHLYSFSFYPHPNWSRTFAPWDEILAYMKACARDLGLRSRIELNREVVSARWHAPSQCWHVRTACARRYRARHFMLATGPLHKPHIPPFEGRDRFRGHTMHSARWDHSYPFEGKRVVAIGTGASAIQFVPAIAPRVGRLAVIQRSAAWVIPRRDRPYRKWEKRLWRAVPFARKLHRAWLYWQNEARVIPMHRPWLSAAIARGVARRLARTVSDRRTREALLPDYQMGCKRVLLSNDWFPTFERENVELVTSAIERFEEHAVVLGDGRRLEADCVIYGTGFVVDPRRYLAGFEIVGRTGSDLKEHWRALPNAYLGTTCTEFPNLFVMTGPNTGLGHSSIIFMIECQARHVAQCLRHARKIGAHEIEVRAEAQRRFVRSVQRALRGKVWASGCRSWYVDEQGRNFTLWPGTTTSYWRRTRRLEPRDYHWRLARSNGGD